MKIINKLLNMFESYVILKVIVERSSIEEDYYE